MAIQQAPGLYREDVFPARRAALPTGVPAFLGYTAAGVVDEPVRLTLFSHLAEAFGSPVVGSYLAAAVEGFFLNGGRECLVVPLAAGDPEDALAGGLAALAPRQDLDLVCAPDLMAGSPPATQVLRMQSAILAHCDEQGDRMALLDARPGIGLTDVLAQRNGLDADNGALYYPWVRLPGGGFVPPCGHVAGVVARCDLRTGVHKAPANEELAGVVDLEAKLTDMDQASLNPVGINALRAFPGRGIRVWGARTLSRQSAWTYISVRRLFLTAARWMELNLAGVAFEPHDTKLWNRITRELTTYFEGLFRAGALKGRTAAEAFFVKCDGEVNPPEVREAGRVVTVIGLAPGVPNEFVVVRIIHGASGVGVET
ncbi:MAG TPA: phage tail sheath subtilisin-like domain-containing protein [Thermoanaerobaculia bacterium]|nr:phage tail sheath subtilisin-like domain-containing protein [Thermoanaerobaculia bacterium]